MSKTKLRTYYDDLPSRTVTAPKADFVRKIAQKCKVNESTVRSWIYGSQRPDMLRTEIIAKELGVQPHEVFN